MVYAGDGKKVAARKVAGQKVVQAIESKGCRTPYIPLLLSGFA